MHDLDIGGNHTIVDWNQFCRDVCVEFFLRNPGRVLTRGQLIDRVWGADYVGDTKTLDVHVKRLRAKIEADPANPATLTTVRGLGYKLDA